MTDGNNRFNLSMDAFTKDVEIRSDKGRRVAIVKAMSSEQMTWIYADVMCSALNAHAAQGANEANRR